MNKNRIWEIDFLRFLAILFMVAFHLVYDLKEFGNVNIQYEYGFWWFIGKASAILFIFVSGISSGFSRHDFKRGLKVFGFGMLVTIITYFFDSSSYVRFGILHFLGVSIMLFRILKKQRNWVLGVNSILSFIIGLLIKNTTLGTVVLLPLGLSYKGFQSIDYYPLLPYISYFILGVLCYKLYYYKRTSIFKFNFSMKLFEFISKNSLIIYLVHQPVLLAGVYLFSFIK